MDCITGQVVLIHSSYYVHNGSLIKSLYYCETIGWSLSLNSGPNMIVQLIQIGTRRPHIVDNMIVKIFMKHHPFSRVLLQYVWPPFIPGLDYCLQQWHWHWSWGSAGRTETPEHDPHCTWAPSTTYVN